MKILYIDRETGKERVEAVPGDKLIQWSYNTNIGKGFLELFTKKKLFSNFMGFLMNTSYSRRKIKSFVEDHQIDLKESERETLEEYESFNDFFIRKLKKETRPIDTRPHILISPADGKILVFEAINIHRLIQVKGLEYTLAELIGDEALATEYEGGVCIVVRLAPADYHRFHFPQGGIPTKSQPIKGSYYSVNPHALKRIEKLYCQNKRELTVLESDYLDKILMLEVGATGVGTIIQTYQPGQRVEKGAEKGYFKFGGSTTILFLKKNVIKMDQDLLDNTEQGYETKVKMGEALGKALKKEPIT